MVNFLNLLDGELFRYFNQGLGSQWLDPVMLFFSSEKILAVIVLLWMLYLLVTKNYHILKKYVPLLSLTLILTDSFSFRVLKPGFSRLRPCYQFNDVRLVAARCGSDFGFPSNHAANSFAFASLLYLLGSSRRRGWWFLMAVLISYTRIYLGVHFPGDVLLGAVVGSSIAMGAYWARKVLRQFILQKDGKPLHDP